MVQCVTLNSREAAEYLGISYWLLLEMVKRGEITPIKAGKRYLFRQSGIDDWMEKQEKRKDIPQKVNSNQSLIVVRAK